MRALPACITLPMTSGAFRLLAAAIGIALMGCATNPNRHPAIAERINAIMRTPARLETETPAQHVRRELREKAFGYPIALMSVQDAYDPPRLTRYVVPQQPPGFDPTVQAADAEVAVIIGPNGRVTDARLISAGNPLLAEPAIAAVKQWRFAPGRRNGQAIGMSFILPVDFHAE